MHEIWKYLHLYKFFSAESRKTNTKIKLAQKDYGEKSSHSEFKV